MHARLLYESCAVPWPALCHLRGRIFYPNLLVGYPPWRERQASFGNLACLLRASFVFCYPLSHLCRPCGICCPGRKLGLSGAASALTADDSVLVFHVCVLGDLPMFSYFDCLVPYTGDNTV